MTTTTPTTAGEAIPNAYTQGRLPSGAVGWLFTGSLAMSAIAFWLMYAGGVAAEFSLVGTVLVGVVLFDVLLFSLSYLVEGTRKARDRLMTSLVFTAFVIAILPLVSLLSTVAFEGADRFDLTFFSNSMRGILGEGGGALHAIIGTLLITGLAAAISIPIGLMTAVYLVEYGKGPLAKGITFFVDVMTGIPSIVAGLFAYALFVLIFGEGVRMGVAGSVALSILMIPTVVRSSEEMLKLVPNDLREAAYALGVPKWLTIVKVVLRTSVAGITTGVMLSIARVIGETAPLLIVAGFTSSVNYNPFSDRMQSLPVFVYTQFANPGTDVQLYLERAWAGALTLIVIVMVLNLGARLIARIFAPQHGR